MNFRHANRLMALAAILMASSLSARAATVNFTNTGEDILMGTPSVPQQGAIYNSTGSTYSPGTSFLVTALDLPAYSEITLTFSLTGGSAVGNLTPLITAIPANILNVPGISASTTTGYEGSSANVGYAASGSSTIINDTSSLFGVGFGFSTKFNVGSQVDADVTYRVSPVPLTGALPFFASAIAGLAGFGMRKMRGTNAV